MPKSNEKSPAVTLKNSNFIIALALKVTPDWVTPNVLSVLRLAMIPLIIASMALASFKLAILLFIFAALLDTLDGTIARARGQITDLGIILDPLADKLLIMTIVGMLLLYYPFKLLIIYVFIFDFFILLISALKVSQFKSGATLPIKPSNVWGKGKMLTQVTGICLALLWLVWPGDYLLYGSAIIIWLSLALQIVSAITYM